MIYDLVDLIVELIKAILIALLPTLVVPLFEFILLKREKFKGNKEPKHYDVIRVVLIYILYPVIALISLVGSIIQDISLLECLGTFKNQLSIGIKIYIFFCFFIIGLYGLNRCKMIHLKVEICNNFKIVILNIISLVLIIILYHYHYNIELPWLLKDRALFSYYMYIYISLIMFIVLFVFIYFTRKLIFIRKRVIGYSKHRMMVWFIICSPLILEFLIIEYILYEVIMGMAIPILLLLFIMVGLALVDINVVYIFRSRYILKDEVFYDLTLRNGNKYVHIRSTDYKLETGIIELRQKTEIYFIKVEDLQKVQEYKERLYILTEKRFCKIKCAILWIVEMGLFIINIL